MKPAPTGGVMPARRLHAMDHMAISEYGSIAT